jgi:hypothetical protein
MMNFNIVLPRLIKEFPGIVSKKTIEKLVVDCNDKNALSYESAAECIAEIDAAQTDKVYSTEGEVPMDQSTKADFQTDNEGKFVLDKTKLAHFANVKFGALVDFAKKDDSLLYTEFRNIDAARDRIISEVVSKYEHDFNSFLVSLQATEGSDKSIIETLLKTKVHVGEIL